jgi:hypothetical protein
MEVPLEVGIVIIISPEIFGEKAALVHHRVMPHRPINRLMMLMGVLAFLHSVKW